MAASGSSSAGSALSGAGSTPSTSSTNVTSAAKTEALLEQLRAKHPLPLTTESWNEFARQIRMASLDRNKQFKDTAVIHQALEKLQSVMVPNNLSQLLERINFACQKLGLKYSEQGNTVYISTDQFYIDVLCDTTPSNQSVRDVRVAHHSSSPASVPAMIEALRQADIQLFTEHIKGFMDMHHLDNDQTVKTKYFIVQQSLESDIDKINKVQIQQAKNVNLGTHIYKLALGLVQPRNGGLRMKLTFFITPCDFLSEKDGTSYPMTEQSIQALDLGVSATIGIEKRSTSHQLQTIPLMSYSRTPDNRLQTQFVPTTNINSVILNAAFVLMFKKPIALSQQVIKQIERLQGSCVFSDTLTMMPMLDAIVQSGCDSIAPGTNRFTVFLPGQVQEYYINDLKNNGEVTMGGLVTKLPFSHPTFIPPVIALLRQQLMQNTMVLSCVRSSKDVKVATKPVHMELKVVTNQLLTVTFKNPFADSVATVDFDITDVSSPKCAVYSSTTDICTNSYASKVIQRCFSIPITLRAILKQAGHQEENLPPPTKKVKADHGEIMQQISNIYTSRGHYVPYGSVNTTSSSYTNNIKTNKYPLCLRRFSGYKRRACFSTINPPNSLAPSSSKPQSSLVGIHPVTAQPSDKSKLSNTPMLSSLLDDKDASQVSGIKAPVHPLVFEPTQGITPQYPASILTDLLGGPEGLNAAATDKKTPKKPRQKRRISEGPSSSAGGTAAAAAATAAAIRKRKKSDNEEMVREITSRVKAEVTEQQAHTATRCVSPQLQQMELKAQEVKFSSTLASNIHSPTIVKPLASKGVQNESHLVQLLHDAGDDKKPKPIVKTKVVTVSDLFDSAKQMKQEALHHDVKGPTSVTIKTVRPRKSVEEKKVVKHSASADSQPKEKKYKRTDSAEVKVKDNKSLDQMPLSPGKKSASRGIVKPKIKVQSKSESGPVISMKNAEDRASPKEKVRKQGSEKKKRLSKSPVSATAEPSAKASPQEVFKMGFYGASNLKSLPKIPKRKPGESQPSPTSPTPPTLAQKSPIPFEWQRASPVPNRSLPAKPEEVQVAASVNRNKSFPTPSDVQAKRPALLPTPNQPPMIDVSQKIAQNKNSLNDVILRLHHPGQSTAYLPAAGSASQGFQPLRYNMAAVQKSRAGVEPSPNSPDDLSIVLESQPVAIPTQPVQNNPSSPAPELVTQAPRSIPLDPNKPSAASGSADSASRPVLTKQKPVSSVSRPLRFSPNPSVEGRLDDDLMDVALGCN